METLEKGAKYVKVNSKDNSMTSMTSLWCVNNLTGYLNVCWVYSSQRNKT